MTTLKRYLIVVVCVLATTACFTLSQEEPTPETTPTPQPLLEGAIAYPYPENVNPLTGLPVDDPNTLNRRPIIVKVSNSPALVRPQSGISLADVVYEHYTEVGITRFSAVFYTHAPQRVGSIRSARLIDYELAVIYQGLLAFAGASIGIDKRIYGSEYVINDLCKAREDKEQCTQEVNVVGPPNAIPPSDFVERAYKAVLLGAPSFYRDEAVAVPHNLFANLVALWERAERDGNAQKPDLNGMVFHLQPPANNDGVGIFAQVRYLTTFVEWHYDPATNKYYRSSDGQPHFDVLTDTQISADNVLIINAGHYLTDIVESLGANNTIHWSAQITIWSRGNAVLLRDGVRYTGYWVRDSRPEMMTFYQEDGTPFYFKPGNTWVQVLPFDEQMNPEYEWVKVE